MPRTTKIPPVKLKILIVDDEELILQSISQFLELHGYKADTTTNPLEVMELIEKNNYNVVILDIMMPEMDGLELLEEIRNYNGSIFVITITAYCSMTNLLTAIRRGAFEVIFKPFKDMNLFLKTLKEIEKKIKHWYKLMEETHKNK